MNQRNYRKSLKKWNYAVYVLSNATAGENCYNELSLKNACGFCYEFGASDDNCAKCPLFPKYCSNEPSDALFWQIISAVGAGKNKEGLELSKQMLAEIKKHRLTVKPFVSQEETGGNK